MWSTLVSSCGKNEAGDGAVRVQLAVGIYQFALGGGNASPAVHHGAQAAQWSGTGQDGADK